MANANIPSLLPSLLDELKKLLDGGQAHATFDAAIKDFPPHLRGIVPHDLPYSAWQILEHIRIAQRDILEYSTNQSGTYKPIQWPQAYWPRDPAPPTASAWDDAVHHIRADRAAFEQLLHSASESALITPFPWGDGQTLLREAFLIADHAAYHVGELIILRRLLGAWKT